MTQLDFAARTEAVRRAVSSSTTCNQSTVDQLATLLGHKSEPALSTKPNSNGKRVNNRVQKPRTASKTLKSRGNLVSSIEVLEIEEPANEQLKEPQALRFATEVVNETLRGLTQAAKEYTVQKSKGIAKDGSCTPKKSSIKEHSSPQPLRARSVNRIPATPNGKSKSVSISVSSTSSSNAIALAECSILAFATLRKLQRQDGADQKALSLRLDSGTSALIGKLIALDMNKHAIKELGLLIRRLSCPNHDKLEHSVNRTITSKMSNALSIADLLSLGDIPKDPKQLNLLSTSLIQALKLLTLNPKTAYIEAALENMDWSKPNTILHCMTQLIRSSRSEEVSKNAQLLEQAAGLIGSLIPDLPVADGSSIQDNKQSISFECATRLAILSCLLQQLSWESSGCNSDRLRHNWNRLLYHLGAFARRSRLAIVQKYEFLKMNMKSIIDSSLKESAPEKLVLAHRLVLSETYKILSELAFEAKISDQADLYEAKWMLELRGLNASGALTCSALCQLASIRLRGYLEDRVHAGDENNAKDLQGKLQNFIEYAGGDLSGSITEFDSLLLALATLQKQAIGVLKNGFSTQGNINDDSLKALLQGVIHVNVRIIARCAQAMQNHQSGSDSAQKRQLTLLARLAIAAFESLGYLSRDPVFTRELWPQMDESIQNCFRLASTLEELAATQEIDLHPSFDKAFINLSNAYWCIFQSFKNNNTDSLNSRSALRRSVDILDGRSNRERITGFIHVKLEKLAALHESQNNPEKAFDAYYRAITFLIESDYLEDIKGTASKSFPSTIIHQVERLSIFSRILQAYLRAGFKVDDNKRDLLLCVPEDMHDSGSRGLILEIQLSSLLSLVPDKQWPQSAVATFKKNVASLFEIYVEAKYPLRRLQTIVQLLHAKFLNPVLEVPDYSDFIDNVRCRSNFDQDSRLANYKAHLLAHCDLYTAISIQGIDQGLLEQSLSVWDSLLSSAATWAKLREVIADPSNWIKQLDGIAEYLHAQGLETERAMILQLIHCVNSLDPDSNMPSHISKTCALGVQLTRLGHPGKAAAYFQKCQALLKASDQPVTVSVQWHIGYAEYLWETGNIDKSEEFSDKSQQMLEALMQQKTSSSRLRERYAQLMLTSESLDLKAQLMFSSGESGQAIYYAKRSLKLMYKAWSLLERQHGEKAKLSPNSGGETESLSDASTASESIGKPLIVSNSHDSLRSSSFWSLVSPLFHKLLHLSTFLSHIGLLTDARYYADNAKKIAEAVRANHLLSKVRIIQGSYEIHSGNIDAGKQQLKEIAGDASCLPYRTQSMLHMQIAEAHQLSQELEDAKKRLGVAESSLKLAFSTQFIRELPASSINVEEVENKVKSLSLTSLKGPVSRKRQTGAQSKRKTGSNGSASKTANSTEEDIGCFNLLKDKAAMIRQRFCLALQVNDVTRAELILSEAENFAFPRTESMKLSVNQSQVWLNKGLDSLSSDPVFSLLLESTVACPSVPRQTKSQLEEVTTEAHTKAPKRGNTAKKQKTKEVSHIQGTMDLMNKAFQTLYQVHSQAQSTLPSVDVHQMVDILRKSLLILSSTGSSLTNSVLTAYVMELGRSISFLREGSAIRVEKLLSAESDSSAAVDTSALCVPTVDARTFQEKYIDIIPAKWSVISLAVSEDHEELLLSKLRPGQDPFILTIPLQRHKSGDCDEEVFAFDDGKAELQDIIGLTNFSTHEAGNMSRKGAKAEWWEARAALDSRLKDLLINIENIWLGGFRGLFSHHVPRPELLGRFQKSLYNILDKHLPSRRRAGKAKSSQRVTLDPRVLELFVGLGKPAENPEIDETLMDLLYFVVDILQFHGERNAYDEIDFDPIVLEVMDALTHYHEAASEDSELDCKHTILILDKALHSFPWEALPCLSNLAVSRLPSLSSLRDRIIRSNGDHCVDLSNGAYILNPSGDLAVTQETFTAPLGLLTSWSGTIKRAPTEKEVASHLSSRSIYLYFGHGSGGQYIRPRTIRKLDQCAVALLMGCSSSAITEAGEYESYGTPLNYLHGGAPAVMGTLWDVTDKDIDRFSMSTLQKWGLFEYNSDQASASRSRSASPVKKSAKGKSKAKGKAKEGTTSGEEKKSLDQAVAESRSSCIFRYLNGAAPVVYGVPVYLA